LATTTFFEQTIQDKEDASIKMELEFGRSSFYRDNLIYIKVDDKTVIVNEETGREIYDAMMRLGSYLGYDRD
jgi:hypothetical protein